MLQRQKSDVDLDRRGREAVSIGGSSSRTVGSDGFQFYLKDADGSYSIPGNLTIHATPSLTIDSIHPACAHII